MIENLNSLKPLLIIVAIVFTIVFCAILIDLVSGLHKAKLTNQLRTSKALRATIGKFIEYQGSIALAFGMDVCLNMSNLLKLIQVVDLTSIPIFSLIMGLFLCAVEIKSVRENADVKERKREKELVNTLMKVAKAVGPEKVKDIIKAIDAKEDK